jgi:dihydrofolate synthase/folylpolyglutamate synthase
MVIVDVAHNVASIAAMLGTLEELFPHRTGKRILIFATSVDKDTLGMLRLLLERFDTLVLTRYLNNPRFVQPERLLEMARALETEIPGRPRQLISLPDPAAAWSFIDRTAGPNELVCAAGSFFLAAEIRQLVIAQNPRAMQPSG